MDRFLEVGDVFVCKAFATKLNYEVIDADNKPPELNQKRLEVGEPHKVTYLWTERLVVGGKTYSRDVETVIDCDASDPARGECEWLVIRTEMSGGGSAYDGDYPDGWGVQAKRLGWNGRYNPDGEEVFFRQSGCFCGLIEPGEFECRRRMRMTFVPEAG